MSCKRDECTPELLSNVCCDCWHAAGTHRERDVDEDEHLVGGAEAARAGHGAAGGGSGQSPVAGAAGTCEEEREARGRHVARLRSRLLRH